MNRTLLSVPGFLPPDECTAIIRDVERRGFGPAPITTAFGFQMMPEVRNNTRVMVDDVGQARRLWVRFRELVPLEPIRGWKALGLNERFRYYRYTSGQAFRWHFDGAFVRNAAEQSLLTFMVYLNEGFGGGATEFEHRSIVPRTGHAVVFDHGLRHQGAEVTHGTKYVLRSDVMFERA
jgi:prolyl 4-hydroxylase